MFLRCGLGAKPIRYEKRIAYFMLIRMVTLEIDAKNTGPPWISKAAATKPCSFSKKKWPGEISSISTRYRV
jgi:hypothetical protein